MLLKKAFDSLKKRALGQGLTIGLKFILRYQSLFLEELKKQIMFKYFRLRKTS